jgi:hypothetical protein
MRERLDTMMQSFKADDYTVKLVSGVSSVVPFAPKFQFYNGLEDAVRAVIPNATPAQLERARQLATEESVENALWVADALNTGSKGIAVYTGLKSAFNMFFGAKGARTFEADPEQAADAALKGMGMAYIIHKLFPGGVGDQLNAFKTLKAGETMALYYASMEVALPFLDNVISDGPKVIERLMGHGGADHAARLAQLTGNPGAAQAATGILASFMGPLSALTASASQHLGPITEMAKQHLPGMMETTDKVTGAIATAVDLMPVWRLLGSRLAAESVAYRVARGL